MPTIRDVAERAGVSPSTVSRVLQETSNVSATTRERVERAIEELGYVPSAVAQSLRSKRTRSLALVVPDITNPFWTTVARGVEDAAQGRDRAVFLCNTDENPAKQRRYLNFLISQQVDGVIIAPYDSDAQHLDKLRRRSIPTVVIDRRIEGWDVDSVCGDSLSGAKALVRHLIELGHRRIAVVSGPATTSTAEDRVAGYRLALAEAGLPLDARLIKRGEYHSASGEALTNELLDEGFNPTAIFAANNLIVMGVIDALEKRGLRIPQDVALVCFDDLPNVSRLFPFLTVVAQPAYDMGVNAAQLLLSRLDSKVSLQPRHVVLPTRLIVRHSCGSQLQDGGQDIFSLPLPRGRQSQNTMVKPINSDQRRMLSTSMAEMPVPAFGGSRPSNYDKADVHRLLQVLQYQEADRVPYIDLWGASKPVCEYVLQHPLEYEPMGVADNGRVISPQDHIEFALRLGMDAVTCHFSWQPSNVDPDDLEPPPPLAGQLSHLEEYLRAAQGTGVGVIASFTSFFGSALLAAGIVGVPDRFRDDQPTLERLMDTLLENQEKAVRAVCDRFAGDLALVTIRDDIADQAGLLLPTDLFIQVFQSRMARLVVPAQEHGKLLLMHTGGRLNQALPILHAIGFDVIHPSEPEFNDIFEIKRQWVGKLAIVGKIPSSVLVHGSQGEIEEEVREYCIKLAPGGGYVLGSSGHIPEDVPPENFVAMTQALHRYGRYGSLGKDV